MLANNTKDNQSFFQAFSTAYTLPRVHRDALPAEPRNFKEIIAHPMRDFIMKAIQDELQQMEQKGVWIVTDEGEPSRCGMEAIPLTWVIKYKADEQGLLDRIKARICVRGDLQVTQQDTFAATLAFRIFRTLMAVICAFDLEMRQYDVINAFPHVPLETKVYYKPPDGMNNMQGKVLLLKRALYGLKESLALWQRHFC
jgi:hypothetical protein